MGDAYRDDHEAALMQIAALQRENAELREQLERARGERTRAAGIASGEMNGTGAFVTGMLFFLGLVTTAAAAARVLVVPAPEPVTSWYPVPTAVGRAAVEIRAGDDPGTVATLDGRQVYLEPGAATLFAVEPDRKHCVVVRRSGEAAQTDCGWVGAGDTLPMDFVRPRSAKPGAP